MFNGKLVPTNRCRTWVSLESHTELRIWVWISSANKCNIFVTLGLDCNRVDRSQNGTCNAELSSIKPESRESIQSKITEPACAEFSATQVENSAKWISSNLVIHVDGVYKLSVMSPIKSLRPKWAQGRQSSSLISHTKDCCCLYHTKIVITFQIFSLLFLWFMAFMARSIMDKRKNLRGRKQ